MNPALTIATVPAIIALVQAARIAGLPTRLAPLLAVALGLAVEVALQSAVPAQTAINWPAALLAGLAAGLSASGLYAGASTVLAPPPVELPPPPTPIRSRPGPDTAGTARRASLLMSVPPRAARAPEPAPHDAEIHVASDAPQTPPNDTTPS